MKLNKEFLIPTANYVKQSKDKKQIVIGDIYPDAPFKSLWRDTGKYKQLPHYSINRSGEVFKHFDNKFYSYYLDSNIDENVISVALENIGSLVKVNGLYYDVYNNSFTGDVVNVKWKNITLWQPYSVEQYNSTVELCRYLLKSANIEKNVMDNNNAKADIDSFQGICYRSNHDNKHNDLNPSWDFKQFKTAIENE